jgi:tetratricopeptide (TPR) repeat protein
MDSEQEMTMPRRRDSANRNQTFGRLLSGAINSIATYEGRTAPIVEEELGQLTNLSGKSIQRYKAGYLPPEEHTIEILAEAAVHRGYLGREWLQRFLHAARYPFSDKLLNRLCPIEPVRPRPPHIYHNLPAPIYSQFVMRPRVYAEVIDGLSQRSAVVLIASLGGMGKTSLAREVAARSLQEDSDVPRFDAVVWVSDKDHEGTTNHSIVLDEIARTLDYPGFTQLPYDEKRREVEQLLRRQRVLVVIDNFETITDKALLDWLLRLPDPSKAIVTSREYSRAFRNNTFVIELQGMTEEEARKFIDQRLKWLRIRNRVSDLRELDPLIAATGGNPMAIEIALGCLKYERRSLQGVIDDLYAARGELFDRLFTRAWMLLDDTAQRMLMAMSLFPVSASGEALAVTAAARNFEFDRAVEQLTDLALLGVEQPNLNSQARYTMHPLVRAFAREQLNRCADFASEARTRWIEWYYDLATGVGFCWNDLHRLEYLDSEQETIHAAIEWTLVNHHFNDTLQLVKEVSYYYYVRGLWDKEPPINLMGAEAARNLGNYVEEMRTLAYHVQLLSRQGNITEAERFIPRLQELAGIIQPPEDVLYEYQHANALYLLSRGDIDSAQQIWHQALGSATTVYKSVSIRDWLATCLYERGRLAEARQLLSESIHEAIKHDIQRAIVSIRIRLIRIDLDQGNLNEADKALAAIRQQAIQYQDRQFMARIQRLFADFYLLRDNLPATRTALEEAVDHFERLGMRRELAEAREALAGLDTHQRAEAVGQARLLS